MAARSPPPPPPPRLSGTRSSRVGWGAAVHAVSSEASGLRGEGVVDRGDIPWPSGEGSGGQRGPGGSAPAQAPLLRAPPGSERLEGISVEEVMVARMQLLEEELSSLKEELALCQVSRPPRRAGACGEARPSASALGCVAARVGDPASPARGAPSRLPAARPPARGLPPLPALAPTELSVPGVWFSSLGCRLDPQSHPPRTSYPSPVSAELQRRWVPRARCAGHALKC